MSNVYTWEFPAFDCYPEYESHADVVFTIHWRVTADDGNGHTASCYGTQAVIQGPNDPFTPFDQITFDQDSIGLRPRWDLSNWTPCASHWISRLKIRSTPKP